MKRFLFLTIIFSILHFSDAFCSLTVDDFKQMEVEGIEPTYNQITQDETSFNNWLDYLADKTDSHFNMPSFSDVADLTETILAYSVGNYAVVSENVFSNLSDTFSLGSDIWDFMTFNIQQMAFDYLPDFLDILVDGVDSEIYVEPSSDVIGSWVLSNNTLQRGVYRTIDPTSQLSSFRLHNLSWAEISTDFYITVIGSAEASSSSNRVLISSTVPGIIYFYINGTYQDYVYMQSTYVVDGITYYYCSVGSNYATGYANYMSSLGHNTYPKYSSNSVALEDLWGGEHPNEPYLDGGIIVNSDPNINPLSLSSALYYPFKQTVINNYNNGTPIPWRPNNYNYVDYNYNFDDVFWEGYTLDTLEYPNEIEFPSVEFETIEVDEGVDSALENLNGSWIVEFLLVAILLIVLGLIL